MSEYISIKDLYFRPFINLLKKEDFMKKISFNNNILGIELLANNISKEDLGKSTFLMLIYQKNRTQSCATCHNPEAAFIDDRDNGVSKWHL